MLDRVVDNFFAETEQVAFCTQNVVPGIDFTNDPLLQGRNFSYLDTQLKRLGSPNFTEIPVNRPRGCPVINFQQDGHMRMAVAPKGRANYQPNSWGEGPRESPTHGFRSYPGRGERRQAAAAAGELRRPLQPGAAVLRQPDRGRAAAHRGSADVRAEQGRDAGDPRADGLASAQHRTRRLGRKVAHGLRLKDVPKPAPAARPTRQDLPASPALSILLNGPKSFAGRKVGALVTDGIDAGAAGGAAEGGAHRRRCHAQDRGTHGGRRGGERRQLARGRREARWRPIGPVRRRGPVALGQGAAMLAKEPAARDFVADAFAHRKFIGYCAAAEPLLRKAGVLDERDAGFLPLDKADDAAAFVATCRKLRFWEREAALAPA